MKRKIESRLHNIFGRCAKVLIFFPQRQRDKSFNMNVLSGHENMRFCVGCDVNL